MRMTLQVQSVLAEMLRAPRSEHYGLELARATGLKSGTLYPILRRLEEAAWISGAWENIDTTEAARPRRRLYRLTHIGARSAQASLADSARRLGWVGAVREGLA
jgi:DNA-binding PadR family transcriptional regulator